MTYPWGSSMQGMSPQPGRMTSWDPMTALAMGPAWAGPQMNPQGLSHY